MADIETIKKTIESLPNPMGKSVFDLYQEHFNNLNSIRSKTSGYYKTAANTMTLLQRRDNTLITVNQVGIPIHFYGGVIRKKDKLLSIPALGVRGSPRDFPGELYYRYPKKGAPADTEGYLFDASGDLKYTLRNKVTIRADKTVVPTDNQVFKALDEQFNATMNTIK